MKSLNVRNYVARLIQAGHFWQNTNVNGIETPSKLYFSPTQIAIIIFSVAISFLVRKKGFNPESIGYLMGTYAIFIGVFLTLALTVFTKFESFDFTKAEKQHNQKLILTQKKNFFKQFTTLILYAILISLLNISLLLCGSLFNILSYDVSNYHLISSIDLLTSETLINGAICGFIYIYRVFTLYFTLDFFWLTLYAVTSIYHYFMIEYDSVKINK